MDCTADEWGPADLLYLRIKGQVWLPKEGISDRVAEQLVEVCISERNVSFHLHEEMDDVPDLLLEHLTQTYSRMGRVAIKDPTDRHVDMLHNVWVDKLVLNGNIQISFKGMRKLLVPGESQIGTPVREIWFTPPDSYADVSWSLGADTRVWVELEEKYELRVHRFKEGASGLARCDDLDQLSWDWLKARPKMLNGPWLDTEGNAFQIYLYRKPSTI